MQGKNRKKLPSRPPSWVNGEQVTSGASINRENPPSIPVKVGGQFSFTAFSSEMKPAVLETIWRLKTAMYPLGLNLDSNQTEISWLEPIWDDAACLHFTLFISEAYQSFIQGKPENSKAASAHFVNALGILQRRLATSDVTLSTSDTTILVVVGLTMAAVAFGNFDAALKHLEGLHKMVILRGGISEFRMNKQLQTKILRVDLGVALSVGRKTLFFSEGLSWDSYVPSPRKKPAPRFHNATPTSVASTLNHFLGGLDTRLCAIWDDVSEFVRAANITTQCKREIDSDLYHEVMLSIHYRLANVNFEIGSVNETIRLGLLAFASTLFLQWRGVNTRYKDLSQRLKTALSLLRHETRAIPNQLTVWLYITSSISTLSEDEQVCFKSAALRALRNTGLKSWGEARVSLKSVLWVDIIFDSRAKQLVEGILSCM
ncbi:hypothetical protein F5Y13DRAFT_156057 [Hypoxylon sp. FL1857]|nr:hypothetical protein F5Y13DRAFT_156057 [Hypoxylon sp. FL1857]